LSANKYKWHEYGTNQYEFPEMWSNGDCGDFFDAEYVKDWMKRCNDDWEPLPTVWDYYVEYHRLLDWRNKWFNQFKKEKV